MRNPERIPIMLEAIGSAWEKNPDLRLGQLVTNYARALGLEAYYLEDSDLLELMGEDGSIVFEEPAL